MTTPTQALYAACLRLERATGRKILSEISVNYLTHNGVEEYYCEGLLLSQSAAADILEARLWRAVREWAVSHEFGCIHQADRGYFVWDTRTVNCRVQDPVVQYTTDLPAVAHAIAEFVMAQK